ncbi:MAG: hypothetical protein AB7V32_01615 [Candidatus Berkiella sp.]
MLKKVSITTLSLLLSLGASTCAQAATDKSSPTNMEFGNKGITAVEVKNLHHSGKLLVKKIKVTDSTIINGSFEAIDSQFNKETVINGNMDAKTSNFNNLDVNGNVKLKTVVVNGPTAINGKVEADDSEFKNTLNICGSLDAKDSKFAKMITLKCSKETDFENSKVQDINIKKSSDGSAQKVILKNSSVNNITFESGDGIVEQDDKSTISGKVTGAKVEKK